MVLDQRGHDAINRVLEWANNRPDLLYKAGPTLHAFGVSRSRLAIAVCANQVGKTTKLGDFANKQCLSYDPSNGGPGVFLYVIADLDNHYPIVCEKLWEVCARSELDPATKYVEGKGFYTHGKRLTKYKNGARIEWRGGKGEVMSLAGITADLGVGGDEIPQRPHFSEMLRAAQRWEAPVRLGFTAIGRPAQWLEERVKGLDGEPPTDCNPDGSPMWDLYQCGYNKTECPWLSQEQIDATIAQTDPAERDQRIHGAWSGPPMDRRLTGMSLDNQVTDIPTDRYKAHVVMDHGEHIGHQTAVLLYESETTGRCYAVDEYVNTRATTTEADADAINAMLQRRNLSLMSVDRWCGDVNSAGKQATGASVNQMLEAAFADILGVKKCPFTIETAQKGSGSVAFGQRILNLALERGDLFVTENAPKTAKALWGFRGVPRDPETHIIDTLRYALLPIYRVNARYSTLFVKR